MGAADLVEALALLADDAFCAGFLAALSVGALRLRAVLSTGALLLRALLLAAFRGDAALLLDDSSAFVFCEGGPLGLGVLALGVLALGVEPPFFGERAAAALASSAVLGGDRNIKCCATQ